MNFCLYRLHDSDKNVRGVQPVPLREARSWNEKGFGIFHAVQRFKSEERTIENLEKVRCWFTEIDDGSKAAQIARIEQSPLPPHEIIESARGHHVYWYAAQGTSSDKRRFQRIQERLIEFFGGDPNAKDLARILRAPGYLHLKDPDNPFLVRHVHGTKPNREGSETIFSNWSKSYSEEQMLKVFPETQAERQARAPRVFRPANPKGNDIFERIYSLDCEDVLNRLSGTGHVGGEVFTFKESNKGKKTIFVDGKSTSTWIDANKRIGSSDKGGPTALQWLIWYGKTKGDAVRVLKDLYPELERT